MARESTSDDQASVLLRVLRDPKSLESMTNGEMDRAIRLARRAKVLPRLAIQSRMMGLESALPPKAVELFDAARPVAEHHERSIRHEVNRVQRAFLQTDLRVVLLKGAAYVMAGLPAGVGRVVSDVDILVPKNRILEAENALRHAGWRTMKLNAYDQRYYRKWMHELPPLRHQTRRTVLDVHHTILPETARLTPNADKLLNDALALGGGLNVLRPEDMVLHSAAHLFADGDLAGAIRDLIDIDALLQHFGATRPGFWEDLVPRAVEHQLTRPLFYAIRFCIQMLRTPVPDHVIAAAAAGGPTDLTVMVMDRLCSTAIVPSEGSRPWRAGLATWLLYVRSHWLRMPPSMLARHLMVKAFRRRINGPE